MEEGRRGRRGKGGRWEERVEGREEEKRGRRGWEVGGEERKERVGGCTTTYLTSVDPSTCARTCGAEQ